MRLIKDKGYLLTDTEYKALIKQDDGSWLLPENVNDISPETQEKILIDIKNNVSRPTICKKYNIQPNIFDRFLDKTYYTKKISRVREILLKNDCVKSENK